MTPPRDGRRPPDIANEGPVRCPNCGRFVASNPVPKRCGECGEWLTDDAEVERFLQ